MRDTVLQSQSRQKASHVKEQAVTEQQGVQLFTAALGDDPVNVVQERRQRAGRIFAQALTYMPGENLGIGCQDPQAVGVVLVRQ